MRRPHTSLKFRQMFQLIFVWKKRKTQRTIQDGPLGEWTMLEEDIDNTGATIKKMQRGNILKTERTDQDGLSVTFETDSQAGKYSGIASFPSSPSQGAPTFQTPLSDHPTVSLGGPSFAIPPHPLQGSSGNLFFPIVNWLSRPHVCIANMTVIVLLFLTFLSSYFYFGVNSCTITENKTVIINGSPALAPLLQDIAEMYQHTCWGAKVSVNSGVVLPGAASQTTPFPQGSLDGLQQLNQGQIDIAASDLFADPQQLTHFHDNQIMAVVYALVVNSSVHIKNLSTKQLKDIYSGATTDWKNLGDTSGKIVIISHSRYSGPRLTFENYVLNGLESASDYSVEEDSTSNLLASSSSQAQKKTTNDIMLRIVEQVKIHPGAISYVPLYYALKNHLNILSIDGNDPRNAAAVKNGHYHFWGIEHLYTRDSSASSVDDFLLHMYSPVARQIIDSDAYLNLDEIPVTLLRGHNLF